MQAIANEKASSDPSSQGSCSSALSPALTPDDVIQMSVEHRHVAWKLGRQKLHDETKERFYPDKYVPVIEKIVRI